MQRQKSHWLLALLTSAPLTAFAGDGLLDTRISFTIGDDNFLAGTLDNGLVPSPAFGIGDRPGFQITFERLDRGNTGRENQTNFALYKKMPGYIPGVLTEAGLTVRLQQASAIGTTGNAPFLFDDGSFIRIAYTPGGSYDPLNNYEAVCFPASSERIRLGYNFNLSWGGGQMFPVIRTGTTRAPGCKLQVSTTKGYAFIAGKTQLVLEKRNEAQNENGPQGDQTQNARETQVGILGGFGYNFTKEITFEAQGGAFQQGVQELTGVEGAPIFTVGTSMQLSYHKNMGTKNSAMRDVFRNDPDAPTAFQTAEKYKMGTSFLVAAELTALGQALADPDNFGTTVVQPALGGDLNFVFRRDYDRIWVDLGLESLEFLTRNVPGFFPFQANPVSLDSKPLFYASIRADHHLPARKLTPGVVAGIQIPASVTSTVTDPQQGLPATERTVVVREQFLADNSQVLFFDPLPKDSGALPILSLKATLKWDVSQNVSTSTELIYQYDPNRTVFDSEAGDFAFVNPNILGALFNMTARF
jgi:hypothetical protein